MAHFNKSFFLNFVTLVTSLAYGLLPTSAFSKTSAVTSAPTSGTSTYVVVSCNDGDTCKVRSSDNITLKIRLVGIDAPETKKGSKEGQPFGEEARTELNKLVEGKPVTLKVYGTDAFGRNLAEIFVGTTNVNLEMVKNGYAEAYKGRPPAGLSADSYLEADWSARTAKKGIWKNEKYESPAEFRKKQKKR